MQRKLTQREILDDPNAATRTEIEGNLRDIALANRWLGGTDCVLEHLARLIGPHPSRQPVRILDLATGYADIPIAIVRWAHKHRVAVQITAVDKNPTIVQLARQRTRAIREIYVDAQDILHLPYSDDSFDFITCSQVIHHFTDKEVLALLRSVNRIAMCGIVIADIRNRTLCKYIVNAVSIFTSNRLTRHDAKVSFQNAFTPKHLKILADKASLPSCRIYLHGPYRIALVAVKARAIYTRKTPLDQ